MGQGFVQQVYRLLHWMALQRLFRQADAARECHSTGGWRGGCSDEFRAPYFGQMSNRGCLRVRVAKRSGIPLPRSFGAQ